jgi:hypothetical protein
MSALSRVQMSALDDLARSLFWPFWVWEIANAPRNQGDDEHARTRSAQVHSIGR